MHIQLAEASQAPIIHSIMIQAFQEYENGVAPSSALEETVQSITEALKDGEQAFIGFIENNPVGMVRFRMQDTGIYFSRLSVVPEKQGQGIAKKLVAALEEYAVQNEKHMVRCKVRMNVPRNILLYESLGYWIYNEEIVHKPNGIEIKVALMKKQV